MKKIIICTVAAAVSLISVCVKAQEQDSINYRIVTGRVVDAATGQPAPGVQVRAYNDNAFSAMTGDDGVYQLKIPVYTSSLTFWADGYILIQKPVAGGDIMTDVSMYSSQFGEIYQRKASAVSGKTTIVKYNNNDISIDNQIQGNLGGDIYTTMRGGQAAQGVRMLMNGINSLNSNAQPLVIVDGVIQNMQYGSPSLHDGFFNNILANIMVEDIEKVSVLKNGTAIYGAKGANGVLVIETKRNKSMATKIDVSVGGSYELLPKLPDMMNSAQFRVFASEMIGTTGTKNNSFKFLQTDPGYYYYNMYHNSTDWSDNVYKEAWTQNYSINVQGGDDIANYNLSVGYTGTDNTIKDFSFSRFNLRLNSDIVLAKALNVRFDAAYADVTRNMRDDGVKENVTDGVISSPAFLSLIKAPFLSPFAYDTKGNISSYLAGPDDYLSDVVTARKDYTTSLSNPLSILDNGEGKNKNYFGNRSVSLSITPNWDINKYMSLSDQFAFQLVNTDENYYLPTTGVPRYNVDGIGDVDNCASALAGRQITVMNDLRLRFEKRIKEHYINATAGFRYIRDTYKLNTQIGYNTGNDKTPNMSSDLEFKKTDGLESKDIDLTYYLTADYNFKERYYLYAALALDGSSKFGTDAPEAKKIGNYAFGLFPSVEAAWIITNEKWFKPTKAVNFLRINLGFDLLGNDDINSIASRTYFKSGKLFNSLTGLTMENLGNTKLQWETTARFTAGIKGVFADNRLAVALNYFNSNTYNLLSLGTLSYISGLTNNWINDGRIHNQGFDVSADVKVLNTKDWKWSIGFSLGHYVNEIKRLPAGLNEITTEMYNATIINKIGNAAGLFYGYKTDGVFATAEEAASAALYQQTETGAKQYFKEGDMKLVDIDGNHVVDSKDMQIIGDPNPDFYGVISTQLAWKNLTLSATFNYSVGGDVYNYQRSILESGAYFYNQTTNMLSRWTHEGQETDVPRATFLDEMGNSRFSDRWIEDGSYLKLKNITLSYKIPVRSQFLQGLTIWGAANNVFTITKYLGSDPEFSATNNIIGMGIDRGLLSSGRSFAFGVKINL